MITPKYPDAPIVPVDFEAYVTAHDISSKFEGTYSGMPIGYNPNPDSFIKGDTSFEIGSDGGTFSIETPKKEWYIYYTLTGTQN